MPGFTTTINHSLGRDEATVRLMDFVEEVQNRFRGQISRAEGAWNGNVLNFTLTALGITVEGKLTVDEQIARVEGRLPLAALPFRGRIERSIAAELSTALS